jgi:hypothetical protein
VESRHIQGLLFLSIVSTQMVSVTTDTSLELSIQKRFRKYHQIHLFLISNFRRVMNVLRFLLGNSPASEFYMPTFGNTGCCIFRGR